MASLPPSWAWTMAMRVEGIQNLLASSEVETFDASRRVPRPGGVRFFFHSKLPAYQLQLAETNRAQPWLGVFSAPSPL